MKTIKPKKVKLFCGILYLREEDLSLILKKLEKKFGSIEEMSLPYDFVFTSYYEPEFGKNLKKRFVVFKKLIDPKNISNIKLFTNNLENKVVKRGKRKINIDPGYISVDQLILPTAKPRPHRIYLEKGVYADHTYIFKKNEVITFQHTFPDFKQNFVKEFFLNLRRKYLNQLKH
ncbi:MAG: DUF4416 family protein [Candidatus Nanoarchaeia archaeon]|nr:DUF4416 family protein [Candidatus Nanoarchaeia archaeon]